MSVASHPSRKTPEYKRKQRESEARRNIAYNEANPRYCVDCGQRILGNKQPRTKLCSRACAARRNPQVKQWVSRQCQVCNETFETPPAQIAKGKGKFCSQACCGISQRRSEGGYQNKVRRAAAVSGKWINRKAIWRRDKGVCGICGEKVNPFLRWHMDHIVPLARGGEHTEENVQVSHPACNLSKRDKLPSEFTKKRKKK